MLNHRTERLRNAIMIDQQSISRGENSKISMVIWTWLNIFLESVRRVCEGKGQVA